MSVASGDNLIRGNTVLVPEYSPSRKFEDEKYKKLEKAKKEALLKLRKQQTKAKLKILRLIAVVFILGLTLLYRYVTIYTMEASLTSCKTDISNVKAENESLKLVLAQSSNIKAVEDTAINDLHMVKSNSADALKIDLTKNNFKVYDDKNNAPKGLLDRLKQLVF